MTKRKIALVTHDLSIVTGVSTLAKFIYGIISGSTNYQAEMISLATSARDADSIQLTNPKTWTGGITISNKTFQNLPYRHVGSNLSEIEFFRYRPRPALDKILGEFDLVQIVAGTPPWMLSAKNYSGKIALAVASLTAVERESLLSQTPQPKLLWLKAMTKINEQLERRAFERADAILVLNNWLKEHLSTKFPEKTIFAPPGVDTDFFQPREYQSDGYLLMVGRLADARKNVKLMFEAYRKLLNKLPAAPKLVLAGQTAPTAENMKFAAELGILEKIEVLTGVSQEQLVEIYQNAALFILSSNEEGFGLVIAEAMACGLPVVSTDCGGPEVMVDNGITGFLTRVNNAEEMAGRIEELLAQQDKRRAFSLAARARAVEKFSLAATGQIYLQTYDRLLS